MQAAGAPFQIQENNHGKRECKLNKKLVTQTFPQIPTESMCVGEGSIEERAWWAGDRCEDEGTQNMSPSPGHCDCSAVKQISPSLSAMGPPSLKWIYVPHKTACCHVGRKIRSTHICIFILSFKMFYFFIYSMITIILAQEPMHIFKIYIFVYQKCLVFLIKTPNKSSWRYLPWYKEDIY